MPTTIESLLATRTKQQIIDEYQACKVDKFVSPLIGLLLIPACVLLPVFVGKAEKAAAIMLLVFAILMLRYVGALVRIHFKKMDLLFELASLNSKE